MGRLVVIFIVITPRSALDGSWFKYIYTGNKAVTLIYMLYIKMPLIKGLKFLGYRSSLSL